MNSLNIIISSSIVNLVEIFSYYKISGEKIKFNSLRMWLCYLLQTVLVILNYTYTANSLKVTFTFLILILVCKLIFNKKKFLDCFLITFISEIIVIISEFCFAVIMGIIIKVNNNALVELFQGKIIPNFIISIIMCLIIFTKFPKKLYSKIIAIVKNISLKKIILLLNFVMFCAAILFYISYYNTNQILTLIANFIITTIYFSVVIMILIKEHNYNKINAKYLTTIKELEEYENIINEYRIANHENENQLQTIKGMTKNNKVINYIDEILDIKNAQNKLLLKQALLIPTGGLRGLIYSKMLLMKNNNINYILNIDKKINNKLMNDISTKDMLDICQIIGVFLDNAIEAVQSLKTKNIMINIYKDENINIEIINKIEKIFDVEKIDKVGFTTKEGSHGYGLALVSKILKENRKLKNERTINKDAFKQKLIIIK